MRLSFRTGFAGANRRRPGMFFLGHCVFRDGLRNCFFGMPFHRGLPPSRHQASIGRDRGPQPQPSARSADTAHMVGMRWDGGGSHRQSRSRSRATVARNRFLETDVPSYTRQLNFNGAGWTPARPPAGGAEDSCLVPPRQVVLETA